MNNERTRLSIDLEFEDFDRLNKLIGELRVKSKLFEQVTKDLIRTMELMSKRQRLIFLTTALENNLNMIDALPTFKKAKKFSEKCVEE